MPKKYGTHIKKTASGAKTIFCNIFSIKFITFFLCSYQVITKINSNFQFFVDVWNLLSIYWQCLKTFYED